MHIAQVIGGMHPRVRACAHADVPPFPYLGNGWTDCVEIWHVISDPLARLFTKVKGGAQLHVRTCAPLSHISETPGRIALKFGMWLETH